MLLKISCALYATCVNLYDDDTIVVADNYFDKTKKNILAGSKGSLLFITKENKSFQLKGSFDYDASLKRMETEFTAQTEVLRVGKTYEFSTEKKQQVAEVLK